LKSNKKSIWLINQYLCTPELNGDGHRHSYLAEEWKKKGYDVTLITSSFSHVPYRDNKIKGLFKVTHGPIRTLLIKGNKYSETHGLSRIFSWLVFCILLFFIPSKKIPKPDIIIVSSNSLLPILNVVFYFKKRFKDVKFILEIRDIWPLTLIELGGFSPQNIFIKFLAWVEKLGYKKADYIVSLLINTDEHIKNVLKTQTFNYTWISNGYDLSNIHNHQEIHLKMACKIPKDKFVIGYAGSLGVANAMNNIIEVVKLLREENIILCIVGIGNELKQLKSAAQGFDNIIFFEKIAKNKIQSFLSKCDLLFLGVRDLPLYKFGLSMNKTFDYMYAEKPILLSTTSNNTVVEKAKCGYVVSPEDLNMQAIKIKEFKNMNSIKRIEMGKSGKEHLLKYFTYEKLAKKFISVFDSLYV